MWYVINVSHEGKHFFATAKHSLTTEHKMSAVLRKLKEAFPPNKGFKVTVCRWDERGTVLDI